MKGTLNSTLIEFVEIEKHGLTPIDNPLFVNPMFVAAIKQSPNNPDVCGILVEGTYHWVRCNAKEAARRLQGN